MLNYKKLDNSITFQTEDKKLDYKIFKVGRGVNTPQKRLRNCASCGQQITDFRIEQIINGNKVYLCIHCPMQAYNMLNGNTWKHKLAKKLLPNMLEYVKR